MKKDVHGKNIKITDDIQQIVDQNIKKIENLKLFSDDDVVHVLLKHYKENLCTAIVQINNKIGNFKSEGQHYYIKNAVTNSFKKVLLQIKKHKDIRKK